MSGFRLAVDYGTSFTAAAVADGDAPEVLEFSSARNSRYFPSMVLVDQRGEVHVGARAVAKRGSVPAENVCLAPKRQVGPDGVRLGSRSMSATEVIAATLAKVADEALHRNNGAPPDEVLMTHPAAWSKDRCDVLRSAAVSVGLAGNDAAVTLIPEPVAAVSFYTSSHTGPEVPIGGAVAVFDLGGGTFDCAVLRRSDSGWTLAGRPGGDQRLGGEDFDEALLEWAADRIGAEDPEAWGNFEDDDSPRGRSDWVTMLELIRAAKEELSSEESTEINLPPGALPVDALLINRAELMVLIADPVDRSMQSFSTCLADAEVAPQDLTAIYLTGGSSRIPMIKGEIHRRFGVEPITYNDPKAITALGALMVGGGSQASAATSPPPPPRQQSTKGTSGRTSAQRPPPVRPEGSTVLHAECPDVAEVARLLTAVAAFADPTSRGEHFRKVLIEGQANECGVLAGTPKRAAMVDLPIRMGSASGTQESLLFDPGPVNTWAMGRSGPVTITGTSNSLTVSQVTGQEPRQLDISASRLAALPSYGQPAQDMPIATLDLDPDGVEGLLLGVGMSTSPLVDVVCGPNALAFDERYPNGEYQFAEPTELMVPREPLLAALRAFRGGPLWVGVQRHCIMLRTEDEAFLKCSLWNVTPFAQSVTSTRTDVATVRITPKATLGGVGGMGVQFHVKVDGVELPTVRWNPVTLELLPGRHEIECYCTGTGQTYSRVKTTIQVVAGQQLAIRFQQGMTTFNKGKLILE